MKNIIAFFFTTTLLLTACMNYEDVNFIGVTDFNVDTINPKSITMDFEVRVDNPNNYHIHVKSSNLQLYLAGVKAGSARIVNKVKLKKNTTDNYLVKVEANFTDIPQGGLAGGLSVLLSGKADLSVVGNVKASAKGVSKKFPIKLDESLNISQLEKVFQ